MAKRDFDREEFEAWLKTQPLEVAVCLAARSALRVFPLIWPVLESEAEERAGTIVLPLFRGMAAPRAAEVYPGRRAEIDAATAARAAAATAAARAAARAAAADDDAAAAAAAAAAARAATAVTAVARTAGARAAARAAAAAATATAAAAADDDAAAAAALEHDRAAIKAGRSASDLGKAPLWPEKMPDRIAKAWGELSTELEHLDQDWEVWTHWYQNRVSGRQEIEDLEIDRLSLPEEIWEQGATVVNAEIKRLEEEYRGASKVSETKGDEKEEKDSGGDVAPDLFPSPSDHYVFLSYANQDRDQILALRELLRREDIPSWWDQNIPPGEKWREIIKNALERAAIVLTIWTEKSVQSDSVIEEARNGQAEGKLVHIRLDQAKLPYGFAETQYLDLDGWNGDTNDRRIERLLKTLKDRLRPPSLSEKKKSAARTGPVSAVPENGKVGATDTPPNGRPALAEPEDRDDIFDAIDVLCGRFQQDWKSLKPNVPDPIFGIISECQRYAKEQKIKWYIWEDLSFSIEIRLNEDQDADWRGTDQYAARIQSRIGELEPHLKPITVEGTVQAEEFPPEIKLSEEARGSIQDISDKIGDLLKADVAKEVFTPEAEKVLGRANDELEEGLNRAEDPNDVVSDSRFRMWRRGIRILAGFAATAVGVISTGVATNVLTAPEAAKTVALRLQEMLDLLMRFF